MADEIRKQVGGIDKIAMVVTDADATTSAASIGATDDAAWNGTDADATVISLLKAIALNTTPAI